MTTLKVLVYNIMQTLPEPIRFYGTHERCIRVKQLIQQLDKEYGIDVIVFNELITLFAQKTIVADMLDLGFKYKSDKLTNTLMITGGTVVFSKWPIEETITSPFGDHCSGVDCYAAKGVVYTRIAMKDQQVHLFSTHFQAWPSIKEQHVRENQVQQLGSLIKALNLPKDEPVLVAGDFNIDMYLGKAAFQHLLYVTSTDVPRVSDDSHPFTVDPLMNQMVGNDDPTKYSTPEWPNGCVDEYYRTLTCPCCPAEWIDYVLYSKQHLQPTKAEMKVIVTKVEPFKAKMHRSLTIDMTDVSDHFPVLASFEWPEPDGQGVKKLEGRQAIDRDAVARLSSSTSQTVSTCIIIIASILLVVGLIYIACWWKRPASYRATSRQVSAPRKPVR